ncbi:hypothetical protein AAW28_00940 [Lacticaseibacillus casei]|nr:hypothetical protein AAW28_00940 [Lacticaseibacillus casei]
MNETQINNLVDSLSKEYPNLSREYLLEGVHKQLNGDYSIGAVTSSEASNGTALMSVWQGITVDQMGATIDTALGIALSAGTGGLAAAIGNVGKHAAESALRTVVVKFLGSEGLKQGIDYALALTSPGKYIAEQWDNNDAYPSNGIINF